MYRCDICNYETGRKDTYARHIRSKRHLRLEHGLTKTCAECQKVFANKYALQRHIDEKTCQNDVLEDFNFDAPDAEIETLARKDLIERCHNLEERIEQMMEMGKQIVPIDDDRKSVTNEATDLEIKVDSSGDGATNTIGQLSARDVNTHSNSHNTQTNTTNNTINIHMNPVGKEDTSFITEKQMRRILSFGQWAPRELLAALKFDSAHAENANIYGRGERSATFVCFIERDGRTEWRPIPSEQVCRHSSKQTIKMLEDEMGRLDEFRGRTGIENLIENFRLDPSFVQQQMKETIVAHREVARDQMLRWKKNHRKN